MYSHAATELLKSFWVCPTTRRLTYGPLVASWLSCSQAVCCFRSFVRLRRGSIVCSEQLLFSVQQANKHGIALVLSAGRACRVFCVMGTLVLLALSVRNVAAACAPRLACRVLQAFIDYCKHCKE